jgi:hypothetical protein
MKTLLQLRVRVGLLRDRDVEFGVPDGGKLLPFGDEAVNVAKPGDERSPLRLRILSNEELWWFLLDHPQQCLQEFWSEVEARKAAGILSNDSPFRTMSDLAPYGQPRPSGGRQSNLIELTREEWEAHRRRKMFRVVSS